MNTAIPGNLIISERSIDLKKRRTTIDGFITRNNFDLTTGALGGITGIVTRNRIKIITRRTRRNIHSHTLIGNNDHFGHWGDILFDRTLPFIALEVVNPSIHEEVRQYKYLVINSSEKNGDGYKIY